MKTRFVFAIGASTLAAVLAAESQPSPEAWLERTSWGDPDLQGEWTSEGEFEYACHEDNYGLANMLSESRHLERTQGTDAARSPR